MILSTKDEMMEVESLEQEETKAFASLRRDLDKRVTLLMRIHKEKEFHETAVRELDKIGSKEMPDRTEAKSQDTAS